MKTIQQIIGFLCLLSLLLFIKGNFTPTTHAEGEYEGINITWEEQIKGQLPNDIKKIIDNMNGDSDDAGISILSASIYYVIDIVKGLLYSITLIFIIIAGFNIVTAQGEESVITENRKSIMYALLGIIVILIADTAVRNVFYGGGDTSISGISPGECLLNPEECAVQGNKEILGIIYWGKSILAVIAVLAIIISGMRMVISTDDEESISNEKKVFINVAIGLLLLAVNEVVIQKVLYIVDEDTGATLPNDRLKIRTDLQQGINEFVGIIQFILQFLGVLAVAAIIYGGFLMAMNFGDDDKVETAKKIITNAIIGVIIALSSYTIISTMVGTTS